MSLYEIREVIHDAGCLQFILAGTHETGLDKSLVNAIRRTLLNDIPTVAFETDEDVVNKDLTMVTNHSSLHNEMLMHRISMLPLYVDADNYRKHHLFEIHVKHESNDPFRFITANDINIYPLQPDLRIKVDEWLASDRRDMTMDRELTELFDKCDPGHYQMESPLTQKEKDKILRPFEFRGNKHYCLLHELKHTGTDGMYQEVHCFGSPSVKTSASNARYQAVSQASYSYVKDEEMISQTLESKLKDIPETDRESAKVSFMTGESARYYKRDIRNEPYEYNFAIKSAHYYSSSELFKKALEILCESCETLKAGFLLSLQEKPSSVTVTQDNEYSYTLDLYQQGHTLGGLLQSHIAKECIVTDGLLLSCGYKKPHPLEDYIKLFISLNPGHAISKDTELHKRQMILTFLIEQLDVLQGHCKEISKLATKTL